MAMAYMLPAFEDDHPDDTRYTVTFFEDTIDTLVTTAPSSVDKWISNHTHDRDPRIHSFVFGLDVEWRPNRIRNHENPVATLQLCVGTCCLIFQILHSPKIPRSLKNFLRNPSYTFVGVGIGSDVEKLMEHWNLEVVNTDDVGNLAAELYGERLLRNAGLKGLTRRFLGKELMKPKEVRMSDWDNEMLTPAQVQYASVDAFLSFKIGRLLRTLH